MTTTANNDRITSTTVDGVKTASAGDYTTIAKARCECHHSASVC